MRTLAKYLTGALVVFALAGIASPVFANVEPDLKQQTMQYCTERAGLARDIAAEVLKGKPIEELAIVWPEPEATEELAVARAIWAEKLKQEIKAAINATPRGQEDWPARVAQLVIEKCWYDYGKTRGEKQTSAPGFIRTKSEGLSNERLTRDKQCQYRKDLALHVIRSARTGMTIETFWMLNPLPKDWSSEMKDVAYDVVIDGYAWKVEPALYTKLVYDNCMVEVAR